jgi:hypothetical protein
MSEAMSACGGAFCGAGSPPGMGGMGMAGVIYRFFLPLPRLAIPRVNVVETFVRFAMTYLVAVGWFDW